MSLKRKQSVDLIIPVFNEAGVVDKTHRKIRSIVDELPYDFHFLYVDDGSRDGTADSLQTICTNDPRVSILSLSRNFGHQAALTAGMEASSSDVVITMDADGQHPPDLLPYPTQLVTQGYHIVQTQRTATAR